MDDLTAYLARQEEVAQLESISNVWYNNNNQDTTTTTTGTQQQQRQRQLLPFECTACGKCCQTKGSVWMSPEEVTKASYLLDISVVTFVDLYASHIIRSDDDDDNDDNNDIDNDNDDHDNNNDMTTRKTTTTTSSQSPQQQQPPWVKLTNNSEQHCVFLKDKLCQIYEARPSQCSTYPFWPTIMKSPMSWNREVRLSKEDIIIDNDDDDPTTSQQQQQQQESSMFVPPYWTSELGGCEGMKLVEMNGMDGTTTTTTTTSSTSCTSSSSTIVVVGVDPLTAYQRLQQYERDERRFPIGKKQIPVAPDDA